MPYAQVGGLNLYYEQHGDGEPLVMIRGVGSSAALWYAQLPDLSQRLRLLIFDNRAAGRSSDPGGPFSISDQAADTLGLMDAMGLERAHVLGFSMGGTIAQEMALSRPERVASLILVGTHCGGEHKVQPDPEIRALFDDLIEQGTAEARDAANRSVFTAQTMEQRPELVQNDARISAQFPVKSETLKRQRQATGSFSSWERLPLITAPTLVLSGDQDMLVPPANSEILAKRIPGAQLGIVPGGGHRLLVEQPQACNQAILEFLTERQ